MLSKPGDTLHLQLTLNDTPSGNLLGSAEIALAKDSSGWPQQIDSAVKKLLSHSDTPTPRPQTGGACRDAARRDRGEISTANRVDRNLAIVRLALKDPAALATRWQPLQKAGWNVTDYVNYGLRQYLLDKIPADNPNRPWMELEWISGFMKFSPRFANYTDDKVDPIAELQKFVKAHPGDFSGAVADYMLLFATMDGMPYPELEKRAAALDEKFHRLSRGQPVSYSDEMMTMPDLLRQLAIIAQDDPARRIPLPNEHLPKEIAPKVVQGGRVEIEETTPWMGRVWDHIDLTQEESVQEARATLAYLGRGDVRF